MKKLNLLLLSFGIFILITGGILNGLMVVGNAWPTYIYGLFCIIGIIQILISIYSKKISLAWQLFWAIIPFLIMYIYFHFIEGYWN